MFYQILTARRPPKGLKICLYSSNLDRWLWPSNSSERGTKHSSMWIWSKSVQRFQRCLIHKQKTTDWRHQKQRLPQFTVCGKKTKARFSRLLHHPAWKSRGPILTMALHKFVIHLPSHSTGTHTGLLSLEVTSPRSCPLWKLFVILGEYLPRWVSVSDLRYLASPVPKTRWCPQIYQKSG